MTTEPITIRSRQDAIKADEIDPLASMRARFALPAGVVYLDGNSLGALPAAVGPTVTDVVARQWGTDLIRSWNDNDWWTAPHRIGDRIGAIIGAGPGQVICGESTSVQLFQALTAAARMRPGRTELLTDPDSFPTDSYIADSVGRLLGLAVRRVPASQVKEHIGPQTAVVAYSAVDYRSGELWDLAAITSAAHEAGAVVCWDLAHAAGALPVGIDTLGADLAIGCTYKYLNGGPGSPAYLYAARRHHDDLDLPLTGWHGHVDPFGLSAQYQPAAGIERARIGTPPLISMLALESALTVWDDVDLTLLRHKSLSLSQLVLDFAHAELAEFGVHAVTPADPSRRGSQVSLRMPEAYGTCQALIARGVIGDFRAPDLLRLGFAPLYLSYAQVWDAMAQLRDVLATGEFADPRFAERNAVT
jgi:kynureninase